MKGWEVKTSRSPDVSRMYSIKYFLNLKEAQLYADTEKRRGMYYRINENNNIEKCHCGKLFDGSDGIECYHCEEDRADFGESEEEKMSRAEYEEDR